MTESGEQPDVYGRAAAPSGTSGPAGIPASLAQVGTLLGADRVCLCYFGPGGERFTCRYEWHAPGVPPLPETLRDIPASAIHWALGGLLRGEPVSLTDARELDSATPAERDLVRAWQACALLFVPADPTQDRRAFLLMATSATPPPWREAQLPWLRVLVGTLAPALTREQDADRRRTVEEGIQATQKMDAVGELVGGIAHEFNNILQGIMGAAELLRMSALSEADRADMLDSISEGGLRGARLVRQMSAFSRSVPLKSVQVDLHCLLEEVREELSRGLDQRTRVAAKLEAEEPLVQGDYALLHYAVLNLGWNAVEAMPDGGVVTLGTRNRYMSERSCGRLAGEIEPGFYIELSVTDTGVGMDDGTLARVFEPFYTTKERAGRKRSTGLGLATVYGCARRHRGTVFAKSSPGEGAAFTVLLPVMGDELEQERDDNAAAVARGGHVLLVDDETAILDACTRSLQQAGYTVTACATGRDAVREYKLRGEEIDIVILDMVLPDIGGGQVFRAIRNINPKAKVLLCSGYARDATVERILADGASGFLPKPFRMAELQGILRGET